MYKAELSLKLFTIAGVWRPKNWPFLYKIFTALTLFLMYFLDFTLCLYLVFHSLNDIDEFAEALCWFLAASVSCVKMTNFLLRRDDIINLLEFLNKDSLQPRDTVERITQDKSDFIARRNTKYFLVITTITVIALTLGGLFNGKDITLPLKASLPYNYNRKLIFWFMYISQSLSLYIAGLITAGCETFIMVMTIQICSQLNILYHRLQSLSDLYQSNEKSTAFQRIKEAKIIKECIVHHNYVYMFGDKLNNIFSLIFAVQFFGSILNICTLIYSLSTKNEINDKVIVQSIVLINVLFQIFLYCWFSNEVMLKSLKISYVVNMIDWTILTRKTKQGLILMSLRSKIPIMMMGGSMIPMTLNTFITILRTSYAAYNLLQNSLV